VGRPVDNTRVYVLDRALEPVPVGMVGKVYVGGEGLARGYVNRPGLTAEQFVPDPFGDEGERLYRMGDMARYRQDGVLEYIGRQDHQVKVRGVRVELDGVEVILGQHPMVQRGVVKVNRDTSGEETLGAYIVVRDGQTLSSGELRHFFLERFPSSALPDYYVFLDELPLTPNGKVDRRALPAPDKARFEQERAFVAPRTPTEETLASICAEILRIERIGVYDSLFELGGNSVMAIQIVSRVRKVFQVELPLRVLFETPTVADLAQVVESILQAGLSGARESISKSLEEKRL
jgi:acyl carrier protein